jgi:probable rRNA maturation factor
MTRASPLDIDVVIECDRWPSDSEAMVRRAVAEAAKAVKQGHADRALAVLLTDDAAIRRLNATWRGIDKPTNVLSFPAPPMRATPAPLGDIAIAYETTAREAKTEGKPLAHHLAHLSVHGFLHLLGYDHESDAQTDAMEDLERKVLAALGVPDPYLTSRAAAGV